MVTPLDETKEQELWQEYRRSKSLKIRNAFVEQYAPLVKWVAGKVAQGMPKSVDFEDLVSCGTFGLLDAIEKYDPEKNIKFKTYAATRIRGAIFDELRASDWVPRSVRQQMKEYEVAESQLEAKLGRTPTDKEICEFLKISEDEFNKRMRNITSTAVLSLNELYSSGDDNDKVSIGDSIEGPSAYNPDVIVERDEIRRIIVEEMMKLPAKEKQIMVLYHHDDLTLKDIGKVLDITESRVSQLHTKALLRMRTKLSNARKGIM